MNDATPEHWAWIPGFDGRYQVSDAGNVRSVSRYVITGHGKTWKPGRILKPHLSHKNRPGVDYLQVWLCRDGYEVRQKIHRLVLLAFRGEPPAGTEACHNDGDRFNNRLSNLRWDTHDANVQDRVRSGPYVAVRTHCSRGHEWTEANTRRRPNGNRECRACTEERERRNSSSRVG